MPLDVPKPVATYLAAEKTKNVELFDQCFAADAIVHDEGKQHQGLTAIKAWKRHADESYQFVLEPLKASTKGDVVTVRAKVTGNFPGSPIELNFNFTIANDKITALNVNP